jgi:hypothetical protein
MLSLWLFVKDSSNNYQSFGYQITFTIHTNFLEEISCFPNVSCNNYQIIYHDYKIYQKKVGVATKFLVSTARLFTSTTRLSQTTSRLFANDHHIFHNIFEKFSNTSYLTVKTTFSVSTEVLGYLRMP